MNLRDREQLKLSTEQLTDAEIEFYADSLSPSPWQRAGGVTRPAALLLGLLCLVGEIASIALLVSEINHRRHPGMTLSCTLNRVVNCADAMDSWQGHLVFGMPNSVFGILGFLALGALAVHLFRPRKLPVWAWFVIGLGLLVGSAVVLWFIYQSLFVLRALCPYCSVVWAVVWALAYFWLAQNLRRTATPQYPLRGVRRILVGYWWLAWILTMILLFVLVVCTFGIYAIF